MVMGSFIPGLRRKYPAHEYVSAVLLVVGLILFTLADAQTSPNFSVLGVLMVSGALVMDSFLGNLQEAIFTLNPETTQVICISWYSLELHRKCVKEKCSWKSCVLLALTDGDAFLLNCCRSPFLDPTNAFHRRVVQSMEFMFSGEIKLRSSKAQILMSKVENFWFFLLFSIQHLYVYGVLVFEAMATFIGQVSVLSLIAIFGAATTAMVHSHLKLFFCSIQL